VPKAIRASPLPRKPKSPGTSGALSFSLVSFPALPLETLYLPIRLRTCTVPRPIFLGGADPCHQWTTSRDVALPRTRQEPPLADAPHVPYIYTEWRVPPSRVGRQSTGLRRLRRSASDERGGGPCISMGAALGRVAMCTKCTRAGKAALSSPTRGDQDSPWSRA
jgi:hypothetical protein